MCFQLHMSARTLEGAGGGEGLGDVVGSISRNNEQTFNPYHMCVVNVGRFSIMSD